MSSQKETFAHLPVPTLPPMELYTALRGAGDPAFPQALYDSLIAGSSKPEIVAGSRSFHFSQYLRTAPGFTYVHRDDGADWLGLSAYRAHQPLAHFCPPAPLAAQAAATGTAADPMAQHALKLAQRRYDDLAAAERAWHSGGRARPESPVDAERLTKVFRARVEALAQLGRQVRVAAGPGAAAFANPADVRLLSPAARAQILAGNMPYDPITGQHFYPQFKPGIFVYAERFPEVAVEEEEVPTRRGATTRRSRRWVPVLILISCFEAPYTFAIPNGLLLDPDHYLLDATGLFTGNPSADDLAVLCRFWNFFFNTEFNLAFLNCAAPAPHWKIVPSEADGPSSRPDPARLDAIPHCEVQEQALGRPVNRTPVLERPGSLFEFGVSCNICQMEYAAGHDLSVLSCRHVFHTNCIGYWFGMSLKPRCPWCQQRPNDSDSSQSSTSTAVVLYTGSSSDASSDEA